MKLLECRKKDFNYMILYTYNVSKLIKLMLIILLSLIMLLKTEVYANSDEVGIYGKDYFGEEYSNGYIRNRNYTNVITTSSGISVKNGKQIISTGNPNYKYYTCTNTSKSEYIDYFQAARYINSNGESIWLDMRIYAWTNNSRYPWAININSLGVGNHFGSNNVIEYTTMEFHFYTTGHCGEEKFEQSFKGIICLSDLDTSEGFLLYSGYNKFYIKEGIKLISVLRGNQNSTSTYNPFSRSGISSYSYFFGTRENDVTDNIWVEIDSSPSSPFSIMYGTKLCGRGAGIYYTGTPIEYYIDGELKDTSYCVPYGKYKLIDTSNLDAQKHGYYIDGWYTDPNCTIKAEDGIAGESTIRVYGKYIRYTITVDNEKEGHTYNSYQVFQGNYYEKEGNNGEKIPTLLNIEWGKELQKEIEEGKTHGDKIIEKLKEKNPELYKDCQIAEDIAKVLQGKPNDGEIIREFTDIVGKYILDNNIPITKGTSEVVEEKDKEGNIVSNYKIKDLEPGYYIVIDASVNEKDDAYSRYLIDVVQDVTMYPKTSIPRLNKKVIGNNIKKQVEGTSEENPIQYIEDEKRNTATYKKESEVYNAADYDIEFELKSYIPDVTGYSTYKFELVDILAKGFDYDKNSVKVIIGENEYPKTREKVIKGNEDIRRRR